jgi:cysteine desulfuration protein SufE
MMPTSQLDNIIEEFQSLDKDFRLELLLDYAEKLPALPPEFQEDKQKEMALVPECQTPVYLFIGTENDTIEIYAEVAPESPTIRGVVSILVHALQGTPVQTIENIPYDLIYKLGLAHKIGSMRSHGINAIIQRIKERIKQESGSTDKI